MGILDEDVQRVREATDLVALAGEHLGLRRVGRRFTGLCPFHTEKSPSFSINPELQLYYCFGCGKSGDAITFVREVEHLDFVDAVERLAARANITLRYDDVTVSKDRQRRTRLAEAVAAAITYYHRVLLEAPEGGLARRYLRSRGFDGDAARTFVLGYSPEGYDALSVQLQQQKFSRDDVVDAGLAFVNRANRLQDSFRGRLMFPIYDSRGEPSGFGGRTLTNEGPKYKNSAESPIYQKSRLLYGLNWAKGEIVARGEAVICEGYTDVMAFVLSGAPNAVATCGTSLTDEHFAILKNLARKVTLAYDADAAGLGATEKWYAWEQKYEVQLQVADLPAGRDPADTWKEDPAALTKALENAKPFLQFRIDRVLAAADLTTPEGRARAAEAAVPVLRQHPNELVREGYIAPIAGRLGFAHEWFKRAVDNSAEPTRVESKPAAGSRIPRADRREVEMLRLAIHEPELVADHLDAALFVGRAPRAAYDALASAHTLHEALATTDPDARELLNRLAVEEPEFGEQRDAYVVELVANLTESAGQRLLQQFVEAGDDRASEVKQQLDVLVRARDDGEWSTAKSVSESLLALILHGSGQGEP